MRIGIATLLLAVAAAGIVGCEAGGGGDAVDIETAQAALEDRVREVLAELAPDGDLTIGTTRRACLDAANRETGEEVAELAAASRVESAELRQADEDEVAERLVAILRSRGYEAEAQPDTVLATGDGIRMSFTIVPRLGQVHAGGSTDCHPPAT